MGDAGWLHIRRDEPRRPPRPYRVEIKTVTDYTTDAARFAAKADKGQHIERLADHLHVSEKSLRRLAVGWSNAEPCWTFPLRDERAQVVGINRRFRDGTKAVMRGHRIGLYFPADLPTDLSSRTLLIVEGGSDTATALDMGVWAAGRFSCSTNTGQIKRLVRERKPRQVVICADADGPGRKGADLLTLDLLPFAPRLKIFEPPAKDLREWHQQGATHEHLAKLIDAAPLRTLEIIGGEDR